MAKKNLRLEDIIKLAEDYGVNENVLFVSAAKRYSGQLEMIERLQNDIAERGLMIGKTNTNGVVNIEANPMVVQLPKYNDTANKTLAVMVDIIQKLGTAAPAGDKLGEFLNE